MLKAESVASEANNKLSMPIYDEHRCRYGMSLPEPILNADASGSAGETPTLPEASAQFLLHKLEKLSDMFSLHKSRNGHCRDKKNLNIVLFAKDSIPLHPSI